MCACIPTRVTGPSEGGVKKCKEEQKEKESAESESSLAYNNQLTIYLPNIVLNRN